MTAQNQSWAWDVIYDPFGNVSYSWSNPEVMNIRFPGQWFQLETGLAYNWHRHYDATLGRYVQPDTLGLDAVMMRWADAFGYVGRNTLALWTLQDWPPTLQIVTSVDQARSKWSRLHLSCIS